MNKKGTVTRVVILSCVFLALAFGVALRLIYLQIVQYDALKSQSERKTVRTYTEVASRGEILDRNGLELVSNSPGFSVVLDYFTWDKNTQNDTILLLEEILRGGGHALSDSLPLSFSSPVFYTYASRESGDGRKLYRFIEGQEKWPQDPSAPELFALFCERYAVDPELSQTQKRTVIGIRYEMEQRDFSGYNPFTLFSGIDIETVSRISEESIRMPGVLIEVNEVREYQTDYMSHLLGRVGVIYKEEYPELKAQGYPMNAIVGKDGVEKAFESLLRNQNGKRTVEADASGNIINEFINEGDEPKPGNNIYLTIDLTLQEVAENALAKTLADIKANGELAKDKKGADVEGGAVVVIDVNTGEVLAMASYPDYDLKTYNQDYNELAKDSLSPLFNRAISGIYPPGSTFKMVTALAALEEGVVTPTDRIRDEGVYMYYAPQYAPACWLWNQSRRVHGNLNVSDALKYSCNYFFFEVGRELRIERLNVYAKSLGLGERTGIELLGEARGNLAGPESREEKGLPDWQLGETIQAAIGQTDHQFTPLQLASYVATVVNGGTRYQPHILKEVRDYSYENVVSQTIPFATAVIDMKPSTLNAIKAGMLGVTTEDGTASFVFRNYPISVGGKTGSAQTREGRSAHGVFVSFAPFDEPEIAVCVIGEYAGSGGNVAPVCVEIYNHYFGINQEEEPLAPEGEPDAEQGSPASAGQSGQSGQNPSQDAGQSGAPTPPASGDEGEAFDPSGTGSGAGEVNPGGEGQGSGAGEQQNPGADAQGQEPPPAGQDAGTEPGGESGDIPGDLPGGGD